MDTLKGEWIWAVTRDGGTSAVRKPKYKSVIKFLGQDMYSFIYYEVYVDDRLYSKGVFIPIMSYRTVPGDSIPYDSVRTGMINIPSQPWEVLPSFGYWGFDFYKWNNPMLDDYDPEIPYNMFPSKNAIRFVIGNCLAGCDEIFYYRIIE